jgi:hypothetical protein
MTKAYLDLSLANERIDSARRRGRDARKDEE